MSIKTPKEFFEKRLPEKFDPSKAAGIDMVVQLNISGDNGGDWYISIKDQKMDIKEGLHPEPKVTVQMKDRDWVKMINGELSGERAYMAGKLILIGDVAESLSLRDLGIL